MLAYSGRRFRFNGHSWKTDEKGMFYVFNHETLVWDEVGLGWESVREWVNTYNQFLSLKSPILSFEVPC